jgi:alkylation response protein AidB-like acyl-CoA dehydrogenase
MPFLFHQSISKFSNRAVMTESGLEAASLGVQVHGGHGYIREWGMEQNLRDARCQHDDGFR